MKYIVVTFLLSSFYCLSQTNRHYDTLSKYLIGFQTKKAHQFLSINNRQDEFKDYYCLNRILTNCGYEKLKDSALLSRLIRDDKTISKSIYHLSKGYYTLYNKQSDGRSLSHFNKAYLAAKAANNLEHTKLALIGILNFYCQESVQTSDSYKDYLNELKSLGTTKNDKAWIYYFNNYFKLSDLYSELDDISASSKKLIEFARENKLSPILLSYYFKDIGIHFKLQKQLDSAKYYFNKVIALEDNYHISKNKFRSFIYLAEIESNEKNYDKAKKNYELSKNYINKFNSLPYYYSLERNKAVNYFEKRKNYDSAYWNLKHSIFKEAQLTIKKHALKISELNVQLRTAEKEQEILKHLSTIEREKTQKRNLWIASLVSLVFLSLLAYLYTKNTKRKQLIIEQEKHLETQQLANALKEQELKSIDAMIEGQEKERQRIANDLHDDLGSLMATVKLHFNALKDKQTPELYEKTNQLIDEAYQKVRTVAHAKNSGVIGKQGLVKAVNEMAARISANGKIQIEVFDHGLESRLENSVELTIFRIIQELVTNVVKHAHATEATIHLTNHDDTLNIMVEDNGIGFNTSQVTKLKKGMGISSIDKRIEHLSGMMTIESEINQGTTIIIDIPI